MIISPDITGAQIVLIGEFDPARLSPAWLAEHDLIGRSEGESAEVNAQGDWLFDVKTDWGRFFSTRERFVVSTQQAPWVRILDFCLKLFVESVPKTPISMMGINRIVQFESGGLEVRDRLGRMLAPRSAWGAWGEQLERDEGRGESGLSTMTMRQGHELNDRAKGYIEARIHPGPGTSIVVHVNDHYEARSASEPSGEGELMRRLAANFEGSIRRSDWIVNEMMKQVRQIQK